MAAIARKTWEQLRDEVMKRVGREDVTAYETRAEYAIDAAYRFLCQTWHHPELDTISGELALASTAFSVDLPNDLYLPVGARLLDNSSAFVTWLQPQHPRVLLGRGRSSSGTPQFYCRFGAKLYLDRKADAAYKVEILYYRRPTDPDFASGSPDTDRVFDELIVEWATAIGQGQLWRMDLSQVTLETMRSYLARMGNPLLVAGTTSDEREESNVDQKLAGVFG